MNILKVAGILTTCAIIAYAFGLYLKASPEPRLMHTRPIVTTPEPEIAVPIKKAEAIPLTLTAESAYSVFVNGDQKMVLFEKDPLKRLPIASITKLMTALVAKTKLPVDYPVVISKMALLEYEDAGRLKENQRFTAHELLFPLLIESSNDAAAALAEAVQTQNPDATLVELMNTKAKELGMLGTEFVNVTGLDAYAGRNTSSAQDLVTLVEYIQKTTPDLLFITNTQSYRLVNRQNTYDEILTSTNASLTDSRIPFKTIGGKTGETPKAKQTLLLVTESPKNKGYIVHVVLGSTNRHDDMAALTNWISNAYTW
jgi:serine-type D-Ala-D-Ala carboxypeptidase (penicillin-binding protein 5/6)